MALEHDTVDVLLAIGSLASPIVGGIVLLFVTRVYGRRDSAREELGKQGDRLNRHTCEIRYLHEQTKTHPLDPYWDR